MIVAARLRGPLVYRASGRFCWQDGRTALLASMYHKHGRLSLQVPNGDRAERIMKTMEARRAELSRKALLERLPQKGMEVEEYLKCYE